MIDEGKFCFSDIAYAARENPGRSDIHDLLESARINGGFFEDD
jgi:hypothetical protein